MGSLKNPSRAPSALPAHSHAAAMAERNSATWHERQASALLSHKDSEDPGAHWDASPAVRGKFSTLSGPDVYVHHLTHLFKKQARTKARRKSGRRARRPLLPPPPPVGCLRPALPACCTRKAEIHCQCRPVSVLRQFFSRKRLGHINDNQIGLCDYCYGEGGNETGLERRLLAKCHAAMAQPHSEMVHIRLPAGRFLA